MSNKRPEDGFRHNPEPTQGVDARIKQDGQTGDVTVSFGDGSESLRMDRREFMRVSGVAAATAAMAGSACRNPIEPIVPYVDRPEEVRIGMPSYYATVCMACQAQCGALAQTRAGRPIKMEGNPGHPMNRGALCARGQAHYLDLYDPDRARTPLEVNVTGVHREISWQEVDTAVNAALQASKGVALLTGPVTGPSRRALIEEIGRGRPFQHYSYNPLDSEAFIAAHSASYGDGAVPHYRFDLADFVVSLGSDFLGTWLSPVEFTKQFSSRRRPEDGAMSRLVAFEGYLSVTGMNADDRYRVRPSDMHLVALALAHFVLVTSKTGPLARSSAAVAAVQPFTPQAVEAHTGVPAAVIETVGAELVANAGKSLVVAGGLASTSENGLALESAVNLLNAALENEGRTVDRARPSLQTIAGAPGLTQLLADIAAGKIDVLIVHDTNPVYNAPPQLGLAEALKKVPFVVSTSDRVDETSLFAKILAPAGHALETWGDSEPIAGTYAIQQPAIQPLWATRSLEDSLITWFGATNLVPTLASYIPAAELPPGNRPGAGLAADPGAWYRYVRNHWQSVIYPRARSLASFEAFWVQTLRQGVFLDQQTAGRSVQLRLPGLLAGLPTAMPEPRTATKLGDLGAKELQLVATVPIYDGSQANNGHLQELPDPITKHVWGSFVAISPKAFLAAGLEEQGHWIEVTVNGVTKPFQAILQPGLHDDVIAIPVGYGRASAGVIGSGVGQNGYEFSQAVDGRRALVGLPAVAKKTGAIEPIAIVQGSQVIDLARRPILSTATLAQYNADPHAGIPEHPPLPDMWGSHDYIDLKWGMAIDLTKCTGCSACVIACQEENNIPVVGRRGIIEGREMHWMRIDRYYELPPAAAALQTSLINDPMLADDPVVAFGEYLENPRTLNQPMLCQHCEHAPCETVCPVSATMHSSDGLNQMAYNRCVGTRYCSNNCPFKVRRYNWFNYVTDRSDTIFSRLYDLVEPGLLKEHGALNTRPPLQMGNNPDVTVRARGVMEKCTFCVQRIRRAKVQMKKEARLKVLDGDVVPACQQTCPADAIAFGNLADESSAVSQLHRQMRALSPLAEVGVHSSIAYLTSVFNTASVITSNGAHGAAAGDAADHG